MEQALAYVCCSAEESRVKVQKYCRKIYELGYVPICPLSASSWMPLLFSIKKQDVLLDIPATFHPRFLLLLTQTSLCHFPIYSRHPSLQSLRHDTLS